MEIGKKLQNALWDIYRGLALGPVAGYHMIPDVRHKGCTIDDC